MSLTVSVISGQTNPTSCGGWCARRVWRHLLFLAKVSFILYSPDRLGAKQFDGFEVKAPLDLSGFWAELHESKRTVDVGQMQVSVRNSFLLLQSAIPVLLCDNGFLTKSKILASNWLHSIQIYTKKMGISLKTFPFRVTMTILWSSCTVSAEASLHNLHILLLGYAKANWPIWVQHKGPIQRVLTF